MRKNGFTLLETLIAMLILSSGLILLANSWGGSFMMIRRAQLNYDIALLLERKIAEIEAEYSDKSLTEIPETDSGDFGQEHSQFTWSMESQEFEFPDLSAALVAEDGGANQQLIQIIQQMSEHISKSIKEVRVSILYNTGGKTMTYSATTYFVDYNQELSLGMPGI